MLYNPAEKLKPHLLPTLLLVTFTFYLYWHATSHNFLVYWDDNRYVTGNMDIRGFTWHNIKASFNNYYVGNYAPVQMISYMCDYAIWGLQPSGFIITNILLHTVNGILLYFLLIKLSWKTVSAFGAALIFLVHPVQIESVVWISQRKNVLSLFFFLIAFYFYILYRKKEGSHHRILYACSFFALLLSLLTKSTSVVFPLVLLIFDLCFPQNQDRKIGLLDKVPFLLVAFVTALVAMKSQSLGYEGGGRTSYHGGTPLNTLLTMVPVIVRYLSLTIWPTNLSAVYSPPIKTAIDLDVAVSALLMILVIVLGIFLYFRKRDLLFWLLLFFVGLLPVSQVVPLVTLINDRYLYLPMVGASAFFVSLIIFIIEKDGDWKKFKSLVIVFPFLVLLVYYFIASTHRIPVWKNEMALWHDAIQKVPDSSRAHYQYGHILEYEGRIDEAIREYEIGLHLLPVPSERYFLAVLYYKRNLLDKAIEQCLLALSENAGFLDARNALALAYMKKEMIDQAMAQYHLGLQYKPDWAKGHNNLAVLYSGKGDLDKALEHFELAARFEPRDPEFHYNVGITYLEKGKRDRAVEEIQRAVILDPANPLFNEKLKEITGRGRMIP